MHALSSSSHGQQIAYQAPQLPTQARGRAFDIAMPRRRRARARPRRAPAPPGPASITQTKPPDARVLPAGLRDGLRARDVAAGACGPRRRCAARPSSPGSLRIVYSTLSLRPAAPQTSPRALSAVYNQHNAAMLAQAGGHPGAAAFYGGASQGIPMMAPGQYAFAPYQQVVHLVPQAAVSQGQASDHSAPPSTGKGRASIGGSDTSDAGLRTTQSGDADVYK